MRACYAAGLVPYLVCKQNLARAKAGPSPTNMEPAYARLEGRDFEFLMLKRRITIGRNSKLGGVDVNMGNSRFISRRHLDILMERGQLYLVCRGKNGVFVDDIFQKRENKKLQLPNSCIIRFPSTQIKLALASLMEDMPPPLPPPISPIQPLRIDTTLTSPFVSPMPSPTGTISAINSCPASPNAVEQYPRRMPFDLMAKYASKLLASQQQHSEERVTEGEGTSEKELTSASQEEEGGASGDHLVGEKEGKEAVKPPYSYAQLIVQALLAPKDHRQTLSGIYNFIADKYPFYKLEEKGWKNSIRHNLSLNQYFMKAPREKEGLGFGKGGYWCMHPDYEDKLTSQAYVKRKKKGIPVFPSAGLLSKSAPPSPTHHPLMASDFALREVEAKFALPHTPPSQFSLPQALFSTSALHSSSSLPASPSRPHPGFAGTPFKYFPLGIRSSSIEALAPEVAHKRDHGHDEHTPPAKRTRSDEEGEEVRSDPPASILKPLSSIPLTAIPATSFPQPPAGVQFYQIPVMNQAAVLPTFLPQGFMSAGSQGVSNQPSPAEQNDQPSNSHDEG